MSEKFEILDRLTFETLESRGLGETISKEDEKLLIELTKKDFFFSNDEIIRLYKSFALRLQGFNIAKSRLEESQKEALIYLKRAFDILDEEMRFLSAKKATEFRKFREEEGQLSELRMRDLKEAEYRIRDLKEEDFRKMDVEAKRLVQQCLKNAAICFADCCDNVLNVSFNKQEKDSKEEILIAKKVG